MSEQNPNPPILRIIIEKGPRKGETLECNPNSSIRIGRVNRGNNFTIRDTGISQKHLQIHFISGKWSVTDLDTSNGTVLNSVTIPPMMPSCLEEGDIIKIGKSTSIMVKFEGKNSVNDAEEKQLDCYPKRIGRSIKEEPKEVEETGNLGLGLGRLEAKITVKDAEEKQWNRYPSRQGRSKKEEPKQDEERGNLGLGLGLGRLEAKNTVNDAEEKQWNRYPSRRGRSKKEEPKQDEERGNLGLGLGLGLESCGGRENNDLAGNRLRRNPRREAAQKKRVEEEPERLDSARVLISRAKNTLKKSNIEEESLVENYGGGGENSVADVENLVSASEKINALEGNLVPRNDTGDREDLVPAKNNALEGNLVTTDDIGGRRDLGPAKNSALEGNRMRRKTTRAGAKKKPMVSEEEPEPLDSARILLSETQKPLQKSSIEGKSIPTNDGGGDENGISAMENLVPVNDNAGRKDLEKITLGEWFDRMERYLPKQINDVSEELIEGLRQRQKKFEEFLAQLSDGKGKLPAAN